MLPCYSTALKRYARPLDGAAVHCPTMQRVPSLLRRFEIAENSMEPNLSHGDYVIATRVGAIRRGHVVVFEHPLQPDFLMVKRVIGMDGETVTISNGTVFINNNQLGEPWTTEPTLSDGSWNIESGHVFVLGDHRAGSSGDSREIGTISLDGLMVVRMRYWPTLTRVR